MKSSNFGTFTDIGNKIGLSGLAVGKSLAEMGYRSRNAKNQLVPTTKAFKDNLCRQVWKRYLGKTFLETYLHKPQKDEKCQDFATIEWDIDRTLTLLGHTITDESQRPLPEPDETPFDIVEEEEVITSPIQELSWTPAPPVERRKPSAKIPPIICEDTRKLTPTTEFPYSTFPYPKFNPVQSSILPYVATDNNLVIATNTSSGKAQPLSSKILTPTGYVNMGDLCVGDRVITVSGQPTEVLGIFPQGEQDVYEVTFSDGTKTYCTADHLWAIYKGKYRNKSRNGVEGCRIQPLRELMDKPLFGLSGGSNGKAKRWLRYIPVTEAVRFDPQVVELDPYLLGLLIGDGSLTGDTVGISLYEDDVRNRVNEILEKIGYCFSPVSQNAPDIHDYNIVSIGGSDRIGVASRKGIVRNKVKKSLDNYGLLCKSIDKHIPDQYLFNTIEIRLAVLQGLMDADGHVDTQGHLEFSSSSKQLIKDVQFLVQSLGGTATLGSRTPYYINTDRCRKEGHLSYRLYIKLPPSIIPVTSQKHLSRPLADKIGVFRQIRDIQLVGREKCQCISVADKSKTYLTNDCIVTHNTICAEMVISHMLKTTGKSGFYVAPLKALATEKKDDWTEENHAFNNYRISECSGDFQITQKRIKELDTAQIISITPEMLSARCRNVGSEKSNFLENVGVVVFDEAHLLGMSGRGDGMESAMIQLAQINPNVRFVLLTATMSNGKEICEWVSSLNGKPSVLLESTYRPVELVKHFIPHPEMNRVGLCPFTNQYKKLKYGDVEYIKTAKAIEICNSKPDEKFLVFFHSKKTQNHALKMFKNAGIETAVYNADRKKEDRDEMLKSFKNRDITGLRVLLGTSALAMGINLPARNVIIVGVHRGMSDVPVTELVQEIGRCGRPQYDTEGFVYVFLPESKMEDWKDRLAAGCVVDSTFAESRQYNKDHDDAVEDTIGFHAIAEISNGVDTPKGLREWFRQTLAYHQHGRRASDKINDVIENLQKAGLVKPHGSHLKATALGIIASQFYYAPFDVAGFNRNINTLTDKDLTDADWAYVLSNVNSHSKQWMSESDADMFDNDIGKIAKYKLLTESVQKTWYAFYKILQGQTDTFLTGMQTQLQQDGERTCAVISAIDSFYKYGLGDDLKALSLRLKYAVPTHLVAIVQIEGIGKVRAEKLYDEGIRTYDDFLGAETSRIAQTIGIRNMDIINKMRASAEFLQREGV